MLDVLRYRKELVESSPVAIDYHYAYVDNMGVFGRSDEVVAASLEEARAAFEGRVLFA